MTVLESSIAVFFMPFLFLMVSCGAVSAINDGARHDNDPVVRAYLEAAMVYESGQFELARTGAGKVLALNKTFLPALVLAGKSSYFLDDAAASISALERGVKLTPRAGEAALWLSRAYRAAGRIEDARRTCETLLSSDPANMAALRLAATIALDAGNAAESYGYIARAIDAVAEAGLAFVDRAAIRWAAGDRPGTMADLDAAMAVLPRDSAAYKAAFDLRTSIGNR